MPTFETPTPIDLAIKLPVGAIHIVASDRIDTVVTVSPTNPDKAVDLRGAEETKVEFDGERLTIRGPKARITFIGPTESVDITVELPSGSRVTAESSVGNVNTVGRLGATRIKALTGRAEVDATGDLWLRAGHGTTTIGTVDGSAEITADHGQVKIGTVTGNALVKASHGNVVIGETSGEVEVKLAYGDFEITKALASVTAKTSYGTIHLGEVSGGSIQVETGFGQIDIGVRSGVATWLDLSSKEGRVRNELDSDRAPLESEPSVAVRARTQFGDITIQHAR